MNTAHDEVRKLLDQIRVLTTNPAIIRASDQIEVLSSAYMAQSEPFLPDIHFTQTERRIIELLWSRPGRTISKDALLDAAAFGGPDPAQPKTLDVQICRVRTKLRQVGAPYHIETDYGIGFRICPGAAQSWAGPKTSPRKHMMISSIAA